MIFMSILGEISRYLRDNAGNARSRAIHPTPDLDKGNPEILNSAGDERLLYELIHKLATHTHKKRGEPITLTPDEERFLIKVTINSAILKKDEEFGHFSQSDYYHFSHPYNSFKRKALINWLRDHRDMATSTETINELIEGFQKEQTIPLRITEEPITPQALAITFTALTELTTKFWLIAKHRFADLVVFTQTHDVRFACESGITIAWVTYNSPFTFALNVPDLNADKLAPGIAEAIMTAVNGLTQRKAHLEQLEIDNQAAVQKIKEDEEKLKQRQEMAALEREKQAIALEKLRLENEKERLVLVGQRLELQKKQIEDALELAGKAVTTLYPEADAEMRPVLIQNMLNNILQLQSGPKLELALPPQTLQDETGQ